MHGDQKTANGAIGFKNFFPILDHIFNQQSPLPSNLQKRLLALYPRIKVNNGFVSCIITYTLHYNKYYVISWTIVFKQEICALSHKLKYTHLFSIHVHSMVKAHGLSYQGLWSKVQSIQQCMPSLWSRIHFLNTLSIWQTIVIVHKYNHTYWHVQCFV